MREIFETGGYNKGDVHHLGRGELVHPGFKRGGSRLPGEHEMENEELELEKFQESQSLVATPSLAWVGRGSGGSLSRYISPSLLHPTCFLSRYISPSLHHPTCCSSNETEEACQCYPLLPMSTLQHCGKYSLQMCIWGVMGCDEGVENLNLNA